MEKRKNDARKNFELTQKRKNYARIKRDKRKEGKRDRKFKEWEKSWFKSKNLKNIPVSQNRWRTRQTRALKKEH